MVNDKLLKQLNLFNNRPLVEKFKKVLSIDDLSKGSLYDKNPFLLNKVYFVTDKYTAGAYTVDGVSLENIIRRAIMDENIKMVRFDSPMASGKTTLIRKIILKIIEELDLLLDVIEPNTHCINSAEYDERIQGFQYLKSGVDYERNPITEEDDKRLLELEYLNIENRKKIGKHVFSTPNSNRKFQKTLRKEDEGKLVVFFDESHSSVTESNFRYHEAYLNVLELKNTKYLNTMFYMSATNEVFDNEDFDLEIHIKANEMLEVKLLEYVLCEDTPNKEFVKNMIEELKPKYENILVQYNDRKSVDNLEQEITGSFSYHSEKAINDDIEYLIKNEDLPPNKRILLATAIIKSSMNVYPKKNNKNSKTAVVYVCNSMDSLCKADYIQFLGRARDGVDKAIILIGKDYINDKELYQGIDFKSILEKHEKRDLQTVKDKQEDIEFFNNSTALQIIKNDKRLEIDKEGNVYIPREFTLRAAEKEFSKKLFCNPNIFFEELKRSNAIKIKDTSIREEILTLTREEKQRVIEEREEKKADREEKELMITKTFRNLSETYLIEKECLIRTYLEENGSNTIKQVIDYEQIAFDGKEVVFKDKIVFEESKDILKATEEVNKDLSFVIEAVLNPELIANEEFFDEKIKGSAFEDCFLDIEYFYNEMKTTYQNMIKSITRIIQLRGKDVIMIYQELLEMLFLLILSDTKQEKSIKELILLFEETMVFKYINLYIPQRKLNKHQDIVKLIRTNANSPYALALFLRSRLKNGDRLSNKKINYLINEACKLKLWRFTGIKSSEAQYKAEMKLYNNFLEELEDRIARYQKTFKMDKKEARKQALEDLKGKDEVVIDGKKIKLLQEKPIKGEANLKSQDRMLHYINLIFNTTEDLRISSLKK